MAKTKTAAKSSLDALSLQQFKKAIKKLEKPEDYGTLDDFKDVSLALSHVKSMIQAKAYTAEDVLKTVGVEVSTTKVKSKGEKAERKASKAADGETKRGRPSRNFDPTAKIKILVKENPKREGSAARERFDLYRNGMTVEEALEAGILSVDLNYDVGKEYISLSK